MQLFIIDLPTTFELIILTDVWLLHQMSRVLRMSNWSECTLQWEEGNITTRALYVVSEISKKQIRMQYTWEKVTKTRNKEYTLAVALPNKRSKAELIIQKLAEMGVSRVIRFPAQRSQYREIPEKKLQRIFEISKEATEQSRWWNLMNIELAWSLKEVCALHKEKNYFVCDIPREWEAGISRGGVESTKSMFFVWPEWWWWPEDYEVLNIYSYRVMDLWKTVLRMETAAIIAWRKIVNTIW